MAQSFRCTDCGAMLMNHAEMQAHAEDLGHQASFLFISLASSHPFASLLSSFSMKTERQGFEEATDVITVKYCSECGKDCRNETAQQMHTRSTGQ